MMQNKDEIKDSDEKIYNVEILNILLSSNDILLSPKITAALKVNKPKFFASANRSQSFIFENIFRS